MYTKSGSYNVYGIGRHFLHDSGHFTRYLIIGTGKDKNLSDRSSSLKYLRAMRSVITTCPGIERLVFLSPFKSSKSKRRKSPDRHKLSGFPAVSTHHTSQSVQVGAESRFGYNLQFPARSLFHCRAVSERACLPSYRSAPPLRGMYFAHGKYGDISCASCQN